MQQFSEQKEKPLQLVLVISSVLALILTGSLNLFGPSQPYSTPIRIVSAIVLVISVVALLVLTIPRAVRMLSSFFYSYSLRNRQKLVLQDLSSLIRNNLSQQFDLHHSYSLRNLIRSRSMHGKYIYVAQETPPKLQSISQKLDLLSEWCDLLVQSLQKPGIIHIEFTLERTVRDITRFHFAFAKEIEQLNDLNMSCQPMSTHDKNEEEIIQERYKFYIGKLEEILGDAHRINSNLVQPSFTRLRINS